jgi:Zn-dependent protease with chaperone function
MATTLPTLLRREDCPSCGKDIENDPRYAAWCEHCGWNLIQPERGPRPSRIDQLYRRLGRRYGRSLLAEVKKHGAHRPSVSLSTAGAFVIASLVYVGAIGLALLGVAVLLASRGSLFGIFLAVLFLALAWVMRPRLPRLKDRAQTRAELPALFRHLDRIADKLRSPRIDVVVITPEVNAGYGRFGWRRRRVLFLGLPFFAALSPPERVALLAHELAHGINGDPGRALFLQGAITSLLEAHSVIEPDSIIPGPEEGFSGYFSIPFRIVQLGVSRAILAVAFMQLILAYRDSQRAEYFADAIAADLAGTTGALGLLERSHAAESVAAMTWLGNAPDPVAAIATKLRSLPPRELDRIRRVEEIAGSRLDATHPPASAREDVRRSEPSRRQTLALSESDSQSIDRELEGFREPIGRTIVDDYLAAIS